MQARPQEPQSGYRNLLKLTFDEIEQKIAAIQYEAESSLFKKTRLAWFKSSCKAHLKSIQAIIAGDSKELFGIKVRSFLQDLVIYSQRNPELEAQLQEPLYLLHAVIVRADVNNNIPTDPFFRRLEMASSRATILKMKEEWSTACATAKNEKYEEFYNTNIKKLTSIKAFLTALETQVSLTLTELQESKQKADTEHAQARTDYQIACAPLAKLDKQYAEQEEKAKNARVYVSTIEKQIDEPTCFDLGYKCKSNCCHSKIIRENIYKTDEKALKECQKKMDDLKEQIKITLEAGLELHLEPLKKAQDEKSVAIKVLTQRIDYLQNLANIFTVSQQVGLLNSDHYQEKYNLMIEFLLSPTTTSTIYDRSRPDQKFEHLLHKLYGCVDKNGMWLDPNQILNALQELGSTKEHAKAIKALFAQGWPLYNHTIEAAYTRGAAVGVFNAITSVEENLRPPTEIVYSHVASFLSRYDGAMLAQVCRSGRASAHAEQDGVIKAIRNEAQAPEEAELAPSQPRRNSRG